MNRQKSHLPFGAYNSLRTISLCQLCSEARPAGLCCNATQDLTYDDLPRWSHSPFGSICWISELGLHITRRSTSQNHHDKKCKMMTCLLYALDYCINNSCSSLSTVDLMLSAFILIYSPATWKSSCPRFNPLQTAWQRRESSEESRSMIRSHAKNNSRVKGVKGLPWTTRNSSYSC